MLNKYGDTFYMYGWFCYNVLKLKIRIIPFLSLLTKFKENNNHNCLLYQFSLKQFVINLVIVITAPLLPRQFIFSKTYEKISILL